MMAKIPDLYISRKTEILAQFKEILENHMDKLPGCFINHLIILPIPGTTSIQHLEENIKAADISLSAEELDYLGYELNLINHTLKNVAILLSYIVALCLNDLTKNIPRDLEKVFDTILKLYCLPNNTIVLSFLK